MRLSTIEKFCFVACDHNHLPVEDDTEKLKDLSSLVRYERTNRGGLCAVINQFKFVKCKQKDGIVNYRCTNYTKQCRARLTVKDEKVLSSGLHNHD